MKIKKAVQILEKVQIILHAKSTANRLWSFTGIRSGKTELAYAFFAMAAYGQALDKLLKAWEKANGPNGWDDYVNEAQGELLIALAKELRVLLGVKIPK